MLNKLLRQVFKPVRWFASNPEYRQWLRLFDELKNFPDETEKKIQASGFSVRISDGAAFLNMYENIFVNQCYGFHSSSPSPVIIDCGANIGISVLWFCKKFPQACITAFEPDEYLFSLLQSNLTNNLLSNVKLYQQAVWKEEGKLSFLPGRKQDGSLSPSGSLIVHAIRLKDILAGYPEIDLLKLDIEGAEYEVLHDCRELLPRIRHLFVECHQVENRFSETISLLQLIHASGMKWNIQTPQIHSPLAAGSRQTTIEVFAWRDQ